MECKECYSSYPRITPLLKPEHCLKNHEQYICSTCGRCICIDHDEKRDVYRWKYPFKSLEIAKLYIKTAEITCQKACSIYEIEDKKSRKSYKIFPGEEELIRYLSKNPKKNCKTMQPVYISLGSKAEEEPEIRRLSDEEATKYLDEQMKSIKEGRMI